MENQFSSSTVDRKQCSWAQHLRRCLTLSNSTAVSDLLAVITVASLPWSTTITSIFSALLVLSVCPRMRLAELVDLVRCSRSGFAVGLFALALLGTLWATEVSLAARLRGVNPTLKFFMMPFLLYHFHKSSRTVWILWAFLGSCVALLALSWATVFVPNLTPTASLQPGVPVKNYIDQSQSFALCAVVLAWPILELFKARKLHLALPLLALSIAFLANLSFVVLARTALVYTPVMLLFFGAFYLPRSLFYGAIGFFILVAGFAWLASSNLQNRTNSILLESSKYGASNERTSTGLRLEYWRKSLEFIREAPLLGHGTGSVQMLFDRAARGQTGLAAETISNPHNQTLSAAVQWGLIGCVILYAMWICHVSLFRGPGFYPWLGFIVVVQNIVSSLFNSHLFDFVPGWIYVIGVSLAAGRTLQQGAPR
ncbi:O-antigen ligase domain-containing protein [Bradyrhizobium frederickii]|uniref:O-antigen ligase domain-containing protein n=1 Tax=Bradyrhizobium frederickii TaxID=2560054 RepID=A0A4Y9KPA9_9BRAD|nr:O-antigen ligase domain-containing protein [Bradyrhizobium frederickii]